MLAALQIARLVLSLFPMIVQLVSDIEAALPQGGIGAQKLALAKNTLETVFGTITNASVGFEQVWPTLEKVIANIVATFKGVPQVAAPTA